MGSKNSLAATSLFTHISGSQFTYILVYVDGIVVTGSNPGTIASVLQSLARRFSIKDPVDLHYFLGIEVHRTAKGLHIMQTRYILDLLTKTNMIDAKPVSTPMQETPKLKMA